MGQLVALAVMVLAFAGCTIGNPEKQWYKADGDYTTAEFERDRRACTTDRQLDEDCLRARGWTSLSYDAPPIKNAPSGTPRIHH